MELKNNIVGWFEIPVADMERAVKFYETVFDIKLQIHKLGQLDMAWFPWVEGGNGSGGSLVYDPELYKASPHGVLIYFSSPSGNLQNELCRVEDAGGRVLKERTLISGDIGYMALVVDTEGNRIALHSRC